MVVGERADGGVKRNAGDDADVGASKLVSRTSAVGIGMPPEGECLSTRGVHSKMMAAASYGAVVHLLNNILRQ